MNPTITSNNVRNLIEASYKKKLKKFRTCGLEKGGEYSYENIVFKYLRRSGHIGKLHNLQTKIEDESLSLKENLKF